MKKAELTTQQIVTLIILIISFAVILFLLVRLNLGGTTDNEICHNSVINVGKSALGSGILKCKTNYICISGGEDCENFNPTFTKEIKLTENEETNKNEIMKVLAEEMTNCWWMFGEGKIEYTKGVTNLHCAICSSIKFSGAISNEIPEITYKEFYEYLNKPMDETQTYLKYLYGMNNLESFKTFAEKEDIQINFENEIIDLKQKYYVITGINPEWIGKDKFLHSYFVKSDEVKEDVGKTPCEIFDITGS